MNTSNDLSALVSLLLSLGIGLIFFIFWALWLTLIVGGMVFWVMMLIDVAKREFPNSNDRTTWVLVVALAGMVGAVIYYFAVKRPADKKATRL